MISCVNRLLWAVLGVYIATYTAAVSASVDIRTAGNLASQLDRVDYIAAISDCSQLVSIDVLAGTTQESLPVSSASRVAGSPVACEFVFSGIGDGRLTPQITLNNQDTTTQLHQEIFLDENTLPQLSFDKISLQLVDGVQHLVTQINASDDVDIRYVGVSLTGVRASDLRRANGVVAKARPDAFADTNGTIRIYPSQEGQATYTLSWPVSKALDADAIAHDGLVLLDLVAVDASGNQNSFSTIEFTGSDVVEQATSLIVSPGNIIFTNLLETATITPSVDFQFRGLTPLSGAVHGINYTSSHPDVIAVTNGGVVYPLAETATQTVTITVEYPGLAPVVIPVSVDLTKVLTGLEVTGLVPGQSFVLGRLNKKATLPEVNAIFNDGSKTSIGTQFKLNYILGTGATGLVDVDQKGGILATAIIPDSSPVTLTVQLASQPAVSVDVPIVARDAIPDLSMSAPAQAEVGSDVVVSAIANDDVAVREVRFFLDGSVLGVRKAPPYDMTFAVSELMANNNLVVGVVAIDSAGQSSPLIEKNIAIKAKIDRVVPELQWEMPDELHRVVVGTPLRIQLVREIPSIRNRNPDEAIRYIDFYMDGAKVGSTYFSRIETREIPIDNGRKKKVYYEIWRFDTDAPSFITTNETSFAVHGVIYAANGAEGPTTSRLIRVINNQPPAVKLLEPVAGAHATVGQQLPITVNVTDDTLALGTRIELIVNGQVIDNRLYTNSENRFANALQELSTQYKITIPVVQEFLGSSLQIRARVTDKHGELSLSSLVKLPVKEDQPPNVAFSHPTEGMHIVAGQMFELRAEAIDDIAVAQVDFYVDGNLVGSDISAPFSSTYQTQPGLTVERIMSLHAVAKDSKGLTTQSQTVQVTLGLDEEPPVVNISSPAVTHTVAGEDISEVIEDSEVVVKVTGYDNVKVDKLELRGVRLMVFVTY